MFSIFSVHLSFADTTAVGAETGSVKSWVMKLTFVAFQCEFLLPGPARRTW